MAADSEKPDSSGSGIPGDPLGTKALLTAVVQKLSSQILLFGLAAIVVLVVVGAQKDNVSIVIVGAILFVVVVVSLVYAVAETKRRLTSGEAPASAPAASGPAAAPPATPAETLLAQSVAQLAAILNPSAPIAIDLAVVSAGSAPRPGVSTRDVGVVTTSRAQHRIGDKITVTFRASRRCYLTLLNVGTSGKLTVLFPNALHRDNSIEPNRIYTIPAEGDPFEWHLTGPPGVERLKALATLEPVALLENAFAPDGSVFRTIPAGVATRDVSMVQKQVASIPEGLWSEASCEFRVTA